MKITKDTQVCISIAERPGNFGAVIFNDAFKALSLDFIYKPFKVDSGELKGAINGIKTFGIRGCGVSMPHKINVLKYLDKIDEVAEKIGAINTIVNNGGVLTGYNTDFEGAKKVINENYNVAGKDILIIGAGGVARAIVSVLKESTASEIFISNRNEKKGEKFADDFGLKYFPFGGWDNFKGHFLINATPVGMTPLEQEIVIDEKYLEPLEAVMDVIVNPSKTKLLKSAEKMGKITIAGFKMALYQAAAQFKLYTGGSAPLEIMFKSIKNYK